MDINKRFRDVLFDNPTLEIKYMSAVGDFEDDYPYYERFINKIEVSRLIDYDGRIFTEEELLALYLYDEEECATEELANVKAEEIFKQCKKKYIIVWLET